jgi:hypothetical protein
MMHSPQPHLQRHLDLTRPSFRTIEIHDLGCPGCHVCEPYVPSVPSRLTLFDMVKLGVFGAAIATAIMFASAGEGVSAAITCVAIAAATVLFAMIER